MPLYPEDTPFLLPAWRFEQVVDIGENEVALVFADGQALYCSTETFSVLVKMGGGPPPSMPATRAERLKSALVNHRQEESWNKWKAQNPPEQELPPYQPTLPTLPAHLIVEESLVEDKFTYMAGGENVGRDSMMPTTEDLSAVCAHAKNGHAGALSYLLRLGMPQLYQALPFLTDAAPLRARIASMRAEASMNHPTEDRAMPQELAMFAAGVGPHEGMVVGNHMVTSVESMFEGLTETEDAAGLVRADLATDAPHLAAELAASGRYIRDPNARVAALIGAGSGVPRPGGR